MVRYNGTLGLVRLTINRKRTLDLEIMKINSFFLSELKTGQVRCGEHSDYGSITLLFQDGVGGLEV